MGIKGWLVIRQENVVKKMKKETNDKAAREKESKYYRRRRRKCNLQKNPDVKLYLPKFDCVEVVNETVTSNKL